MSICQVSFPRTLVCSEQVGATVSGRPGALVVPTVVTIPSGTWEEQNHSVCVWGELLSDFIFAERVKLLKMRVQGRRVWACLTCFSLPQRCPSLQSVALSVGLQTAIKGRQRGSLTKAWNPGISFVFTLVYGHWHYSLTPWMGNKPPSQE